MTDKLTHGMAVLSGVLPIIGIIIMIAGAVLEAMGGWGSTSWTWLQTLIWFGVTVAVPLALLGLMFGMVAESRLRR